MDALHFHALKNQIEQSPFYLPGDDDTSTTEGIIRAATMVLRRIKRDADGYLAMTGATAAPSSPVRRNGEGGLMVEPSRPLPVRPLSGVRMPLEVEL